MLTSIKLDRVDIRAPSIVNIFEYRYSKLEATRAMANGVQTYQESNCDGASSKLPMLRVEVVNDNLKLDMFMVYPTETGVKIDSCACYQTHAGQNVFLFNSQLTVIDLMKCVETKYKEKNVSIAVPISLNSLVGSSLLGKFVSI
jgi:hypothetical protein